MVAVAKRFERRPIESRVGAFPDVFGSTNSRFKGTESRSEPRIRFRLATGEFGNYWWREPSEFGGLVISLEHCRSERKEFISME